MICKEELYSIAEAIKHVKNEHHDRLTRENESREKCKYCKEIFPASSETKDTKLISYHFGLCQIAAKFKEGHECLICNNEFNSSAETIKHIKTEHIGKSNF